MLIPNGWTIAPSDLPETCLVVAPSGNGMHVSNRGSLAQRLLYELAVDLLDGVRMVERNDEGVQQYVHGVEDASVDIDTRDGARYRYLRTLARRDAEPEPDGRVVLEFSMPQREHWPVIDAAADLDCAVDEARGATGVEGMDAASDLPLRALAVQSGFSCVNGEIFTAHAGGLCGRELAKFAELVRALGVPACAPDLPPTCQEWADGHLPPLALTKEWRAGWDACRDVCRKLSDAVGVMEVHAPKYAVRWSTSGYVVYTPDGHTLTPEELECALGVQGGYAPVPDWVPASESWRWNIQRDGDALLICFNQHEKGEPCEVVRYVPERSADQRCEACNGTGLDPACREETCIVCGGTGTAGVKGKEEPHA